GHTSRVCNIGFSRDGTLLLSAADDGVVRVWDGRPWSEVTPFEREALGLLAHLFGKPLSREDVIVHLQNSSTIRPEARRLALQLAERYQEETNPSHYEAAARAIVRQPYLNSFQYGFALRQAETACRLAPAESSYHITLGLAQYRAGKYAEAAATLVRVDLV